MPKLKIFKFPDLVLARKAQPIARVETTYRKVADDMLETMYYAPGVGLAANQVGLLERIIVLDTEYELVMPESHEQAGENAGGEVVGEALIRNHKPRILINPEIVYKEGKILYEEGCLSVPDFSAELERANKIKVKYKDIDGLEQILDAEGLLAVAVQHEIDHLNGTLFIDRLSPAKKTSVKKKLIKERKEREDDSA